MAENRKPFRILFVCLGNICRSPAAEIIFSQRIKNAGLEDTVTIDSAGTIGIHSGKGPDSRMAATLASRGYRVFGKSRKLIRRDLDEFDLILAMDRENLSNIRALDPTGTTHEKIRLFMEYGSKEEVTEVPDPYYGGQAGFDHVVDLVENAADGLLKTL